MPELPEVETVVRYLQREICGAVIERVAVHWKRTIDRPAPAGFRTVLARKEIALIERRGKFIVVRFKGGGVMLVHLRMSGDMAVRPPGHRPGAHLRVRFTMSDGRHLDFDDPRKFGRIYYVSDVEEVVHRLGPEPLDTALSASDFAARIRRRKITIKTALLDQSILAGLGNIYAVESLWLAKIHPLRRTDELNDEEISRLLRAIRSVLGRAVHAQGTDIGDGVWKKGRFSPSVYGREGQRCRRCRSPIERIIVAQRSTDFCPCCQLKKVSTRRVGLA